MQCAPLAVKLCGKRTRKQRSAAESRTEDAIKEKTLSEYGHITRGLYKVDRNGFLVRIDERSCIQRFGGVAKYSEDREHWTSIDKGTVVSMNMWGFTPGLFFELEVCFPRLLREKRDDIEKAEFLLPVVVEEMLNEKRARVKVLLTKER